MLVFIRHGETEFNKQGLWMGCTDIELNANGIAQAMTAAKELATKKIDIIYSSPLKRAYITAQTIAEQHPSSPPVIVIDELKERGFGILEGTPRNQPLDDNFDQIAGVESKAALIKRLSYGLEQIQSHTDKTILMVSHGAVFHCLTHDMGYTSNVAKDTIQIGNCQPVEIIKPNSSN